MNENYQGVNPNNQDPQQNYQADPQQGYQQPNYQANPQQGYQQPNYQQANPQQGYQQGYQQPYTNVTNIYQNAGPGVSEKSRLVALLLCIFLGGIGVHRFYAGKVGTGILYIFTAGLFGIGALVDLIMIACGSFRDQYGNYISNWNA